MYKSCNSNVAHTRIHTTYQHFLGNPSQLILYIVANTDTRQMMHMFCVHSIVAPPMNMRDLTPPHRASSKTTMPFWAPTTSSHAPAVATDLADATVYNLAGTTNRVIVVNHAPVVVGCRVVAIILDHAVAID